MELNTLKKLFTELRDNLESQHDSSVFNCYKLVKNTVAVLESDVSDDFKSEYAIDAYKSF